MIIAKQIFYFFIFLGAFVAFPVVRKVTFLLVVFCASILTFWCLVFPEFAEALHRFWGLLQNDFG